ncbi:MAG: TIGR01777 family protein [Parachlamydiaceae bacterium]|nr:TIGR01777 family protein [Parachlamydiaceae bacterium]
MLKILLSGSSGLIGTELQKFLKDKGHEITRLVRFKNVQNSNQNSNKDVILWDPENSSYNSTDFEGFDVVINLAGENIADGRWNEIRKQTILDSRVKGTRLLAQIFSKLNRPPKVFVSASAVGFYGDRGDTICSEATSQGKGFLAEVCREWEEVSKVFNSEIRTVNLRFGVILSPKGGALSKMLTPFKFGLGGVLGSGNQYISWIALDDVVSIINDVIENPALFGPINCVSPNPVTNREFTQILGEVLHRPTFLPLPAFVLNLILGSEMSDELLLNSTRVMPESLIKSGYHFILPELKPALRELLRN